MAVISKNIKSIWFEKGQEHFNQEKSLSPFECRMIDKEIFDFTKTQDKMSSAKMYSILRCQFNKGWHTANAKNSAYSS